MSNKSPSPILDIADLRLDASLYSSEAAEALYVDHPEGLPQPTGNTLIVGPMGSGKTIMLRAIEAKWGSAEKVEPVYMDLSHWIAQIAGETETYTTSQISPRAQRIRDAMELSITLGVLQSLQVFEDPAPFKKSIQLFQEVFRVHDLSELRKAIHLGIREALISSKALPPDLPSPYSITSSLGRDLAHHKGRQLALLVDQIDQVSTVFFPPIAGLLRRAANHISVLATRPCPTAPLREQVPADVAEGDAYRILELGRSSEGTVPTAFVRQVIEALPLDTRLSQELLNRLDLLANLMWPSLRSAIRATLTYMQGRKGGQSAREAWYCACAEEAAAYEGIVESSTRAWCRNPHTLLSDWRKLSLEKRGGKGARLGRTHLAVSQRSLFESVEPSGYERLLRILLKKGVLLVAPQAKYHLSQLPEILELPPILLMNESGFSADSYDSRPVRVNLDIKILRKWTRTGGIPRTLKQVFISYWMSDPEKPGGSSVADAIRKRFGASIEIVTGALRGSPRWSPEIIDKIRGTDLIVCDLTVPRRDVFVEYGVAIGTHVPVIQCIQAGRADDSVPQWVKNRQFQFFGSESDEERLETSIAAVLDDEPSPVETWRRDSEGTTLEASPDVRQVLYVGARLSPDAEAELRAAANERGFKFTALDSDEKRDRLEEGIKKVRAAGTMILGFSAGNADYLTSVLGGVGASRQFGYVAISGPRPKRRRFGRKLFLICLTASARRDMDLVVPGLLRTHPRASIGSTMDQLLPLVRMHLGALAGVRSKL